MLVQVSTAAFILAVLTGSRACILGALVLLVATMSF